MTSWLENIKNQHGSLVEEEDEEEEEQAPKQPEEKKPEAPTEKPQIEQEQNQKQETAPTQQKPVKTTPTQDKFKYEGPSTRETYLFATSIDKIESKQEREYVENLLKVRANLSNVLDSASKPLESVGFLNKAVISAKSRYTNLSKLIMSVPIPHTAAAKSK